MKGNMEYPCVVCYNDSYFHPRTSCCNQIICEKCYYHDLQELCPICNRNEINKKNMYCNTCNSKIKRLDIRSCSACERDCCTKCSTRTMCCKFNNDEEGNCNCCLCEHCQIDYDESPDVCIDKFIQLAIHRHNNQSDDELSEDEEGYDIECDKDSECSTSASEGDVYMYYDEEYY